MTSDATVTHRAPPERGAHIDQDEVLAAIDALSPYDRLKLDAVGRALRRGTQFAPLDLVHEALCRTITGERRCPRGVPFMAFLVMTMKSIASHDREQRRRAVSRGEDLAPPSDLPAHQLSPEEHLIEQQAADTKEQILALFEDDDEAQRVIMGWAEDLRGRELRQAASLDQGRLDYAIKRIRLRMRKRYPNGWIP